MGFDYGKQSTKNRDVGVQSVIPAIPLTAKIPHSIEDPLPSYAATTPTTATLATAQAVITPDISATVSVAVSPITTTTTTLMIPPHITSIYGDKVRDEEEQRGAEIVDDAIFATLDATIKSIQESIPLKPVIPDNAYQKIIRMLLKFVFFISFHCSSFHLYYCILLVFVLVCFFHFYLFLTCM